METVSAGGAEIPVLGFGTARMRGEKCRDAVESALELGYRHVDTAQMYENEEAVGAAVRDSSVDREEVFLVTKILPDNLPESRLRDSFEGSLERLGTDYVDLLLVHGPNRNVPMEEYLGAMNRLQEEGSVDHIGISNFSPELTERAIEVSDEPIVTNQVEYHPYRSQDRLLTLLRERGISLTAYSPLAVGRVARDEKLRAIGARHGKTPAQVALRWLVQQEGVVAIPKAFSREHQAENLGVFDFELTGREMESISP